MADVTFQENGLAFLDCVLMTVLMRWHLWDKCGHDACPPISGDFNRPALLNPLASVQQPISHLHLEEEATKPQGWHGDHFGFPQLCKLWGVHVS